MWIRVVVGLGNAVGHDHRVVATKRTSSSSKATDFRNRKMSAFAVAIDDSVTAEDDSRLHRKQMFEWDEEAPTSRRSCWYFELDAMPWDLT